MTRRTRSSTKRVRTQTRKATSKRNTTGIDVNTLDVDLRTTSNGRIRTRPDQTNQRHRPRVDGRRHRDGEDVTKFLHFRVTKQQKQRRRRHSNRSVGAKNRQKRLLGRNRKLRAQNKTKNSFIASIFLFYSFTFFFWQWFSRCLVDAFSGLHFFQSPTFHFNKAIII